MKKLQYDEMLKKAGSHLLSETFFRIQVMEIKAGEARKDAYKFSGELLIMCLKGEGSVFSENKKIFFEANDQIFINKEFRIENNNDIIIELIWGPGLYPIK